MSSLENVTLLIFEILRRGINLPTLRMLSRERRSFPPACLVWLLLLCNVGADENKKCCDDELEPFWRQNRLIMPEDIIPENYSHVEPPKLNGQARPVFTTIWVERIPNIDESQMTFTLYGYLVLSWPDNRLSYPANFTADTLSKLLYLPTEWMEKMWKPDVIVNNLKDVSFFTMPTGVQYHTFGIYPSGRVEYAVRVSFDLYCPMDFHDFPHDDQECKIVLKSLASTKDDYKLRWNPNWSFMSNDLDELKEGLTQLRVVSNSTKDCSIRVGKGHFNCLEGSFLFRRNLGHILFHIYVPTIIIVIVSWLSFWLSYEDVTERVMLGITSMLTIFAQHSISGDLIPPVSYLTAVDIFMLLCTLFVFLSILEFTIVYLLARDALKRKEKEETEANMIQMLNIGKENNPQPTVLPADSVAEQKMRTALYIDKMARYIGPSSFILLNIIYWTYFELM